jgi:phenylalanyl-tRNA synthetase alpha chain
LHRDEKKDSKNTTSVNHNEDTITSLHPIEKKILLVLKSAGKWIKEIELVNETGLTMDQIRRGVEWLKYKKLIEISDLSDIKISVHPKLIEIYNCILPERKLVNIVSSGKDKLSDIINSRIFNNNEKEVFGAIRYSKNNKWIQIDENRVIILPDAHNLSREENFVNELKSAKQIMASTLSPYDKVTFETLAKRPEVLEVEKIHEKSYRVLSDQLSRIDGILQSSKIFARKLTKDMLLSQEWQNLQFEQIDVEAPLPLINYGKKNPLIDFIDEVKEILISMGFSEIEGNLTQSSFWNFDALFIPQDHSAREMQDTFYLNSKSGITSSLARERTLVEAISNVHESSWHYQWDIKESKSNVLRTHTTPVTLQYLWENSPDKDKVFLIGRVFRNEKATFKHLVEFHQVEGIYTNSGANLRHLIGIQSEFYSKLGIKKIKFWPTFFPYTEPSLQSMVFNEKFNKWIELFGMGMFRTEVTKPLGIKNPVLAWGGGFERLAMLRFNLNDIRELYSNNLSWLKDVPKCLL